MRDILTLNQWLSPAFPVGAFAFSHGVETAVTSGLINSAESLEAWLIDLLELGSLRSDAVLLSLAYSADDLPAVQETAVAFQASSERLEEAQQIGASFCRTVRDVWGFDLPDLSYPVAVGRAAALKGLPLEETAALYAHSFLANIVSAAIRLVPLGQTEGQAVLARLQEKCAALGKEAANFRQDDLSNAAFLSDVQAMRHEIETPRIFQS